jgi:hypothetical protein
MTQIFLVDQKLGARQSLTKEGFLLCESVPIARTTRDAPMLYAPGELPASLTPGPDGIIRVERQDADVFRPEAIASFAGKPVVNGHPPGGDVNPSNWRELSVGIVQNPRRGEGIEDDYLFADLLITDADAIRAVRDGLREVSCGYDADYEELAPGRARQLNIIGNHVALVEHGRCGPRCSIGDHAMPMTLKDRLAAAIASGDTATATQLLGAAHVVEAAGAATRDQSHIHVHVNGSTRDARRARDEDEDETEEERKKRLAAEKLAEDRARDEEPAWFAKYRESNDKRMKDFEERLPKRDGDKTGDDIRSEMVGGEGGEEQMRKADRVEENRGESAPGGSTGDSAAIVDAFKDTMSLAEILVPGVKAPTLDAKSSKKTTVDAIAAFQRRVLTEAYNGKHKDTLTPLLAGVDIKTMDCDAVRVAFNGAAAIVRRENNGQHRMQSGINVHDTGGRTKVPTPADLNAKNRQLYGFPAR